MNKILLTLKSLFVSEEDKELFYYLYTTLGFVPKNLEIYKLCFIHKSSSFLYNKGCNERLEFLGDAILDSITADYLYKKFPNEDEGVLSQMRSRIVNRKNMNDIGVDLKIQKHLNARIPHLKQNDAMGNCLEALIGAIYIDGGYKKAKLFVENKIIKQHVNVKKLPNVNTNYKSLLLQHCQKQKKKLEYKTLPTENNGKNPAFSSEIFIETQSICSAIGTSKKNAEQMAAKIALKKLKTK